MIAEIDHGYLSNGGWQSQTLDLFGVVYHTLQIFVLLHLFLLVIHVHLVRDGVLDAALAGTAGSELGVLRRFLARFGPLRRRILIRECLALLLDFLER